MNENDSTRYTTRTVTFSRDFTLGASAELYPAGTYQVETADEAVEVGGHTAYVRRATVLIIPTPTGTVHRQISASDLEEALKLQSTTEDTPGRTPA